MKRAKSSLIMLILNAFCLFFCIAKVHASINIVAAENVYGRVAQELGGPYVTVSNILNNPNQDPHLFTTAPSTAIAVKQADIIIYNGAGYDPWIKCLLAIKGQKTREVLVIAELMHIKKDANPHLWYLPETIPFFAKKLVQVLTQIEPEHQVYFQRQLSHFNHDYQAIFETIHRLKQNYQNTPVIATEPVFNYLAESLGLQMHGGGFQTSMMNDVPPSIAQVKEFEDELRHQLVQLLIYNKQVINPMTQRMKMLAQAEKIPVVGVSEMMPAQLSYIKWIISELNQLDFALQQRDKINHGSIK